MRRLVLGIAVAVTSLMPVIGMADDQQIADYIKSRLQAEQQQGNLRGFNVDMRVENGTVWFKGHVANRAQEMTILQTAQQAGHLGVVKVVDDIETQPTASTPFSQASYPMQQQQPPMPQQQPPMPQQQPMPAYTMPQASYPQQTASPYQQQAPMYQQQSPYQQVSSQEYMDGGMVSGMMSGGMMSGGDPMPFAMSGGAASGGPSALPAGYSTGTSEAANLPGYAWPGYAASPNYGAVSYPKQHSASAWPYIGPFYPYPQVPLGWRKVSLEWDDGWWMLDFHDK